MADWEQLEGEKTQHYSWFLIYRNLGPSRSLERAYRAMKGDDQLTVPGNWANLSVRYRWPERAHAYDLATINEAGTRVVTLFVEAMGELAAQAVQALRRHPPSNYAEAMRALEALATLVPAEAVAHVQERAAQGQVPEIGGREGPAPLVVMNVAGQAPEEEL